jgi:hypothetical protein
MLLKSDDKIRYCYYRAAHSREQAMRARNPNRKAHLLEAEERWMRLAQHMELTETLQDFGEEVSRFLARVR